jgi:2-haloacid dehalogenase
MRKRQVILVARYDTILFDADNTLLDFTRSEREALVDALASFGVSATERMIGEYSRINAAIWKRLERGEIDKISLRTARFAEFCAQFSLSLDVDRLAATYLNALSTKSYIIRGADTVCAALHKHCRLYIITNGIAFVQHGRFSSCELTPFFAECFISEELGAEKPERAFFDAVFAKIPAFDPSKTLVVGDSLSSDIAGGIGAGLDTCWYNPQEKPCPDGMPITYVISHLEELLPLVLD